MTFIGHPGRGPGISRFYATTDSGLYSSEDLISFELVNPAIINKPIIFAAGSGVMAYVSGDTYFYSVDFGVSFSSTVINSGVTLSLATDGTNFVIFCGDGKIYKSADGVAFSYVTQKSVGAATASISLSYANGYWISYYRANPSPTGIWYSTDMDNWSSNAGPFPTVGTYSYINPGSRVVWDGTKYLISGYDYVTGPVRASIWLGSGSTPSSWGAKINVGPNISVGNSIAASANLALIAGHINDATRIWYSTDHGASWTVHVPVVTGTGGATVRLFSDIFYISYNGKIYSTTDGFTLTRVDAEAFTGVSAIITTI